MKLLSCYIENYGIISHKSIIFDEKFNAFYQKNGEGKSTLASFIVAMFYGLPNSKVNSKFNERQHYYPFNEQKFGGSITLKDNDHIYKIERFFSKKSESDDEVKVYVDNKLDDKIKNDIGKFLFNIDENSFRKTIFTTSNDLITIQNNKTSDISHKLSGFIEDVSSNVSFKDMIKKLDENKKKYYKTGANLGLLQQENSKRSEIKENISNLKNECDQIDSKKIAYKKLVDEANIINQQILDYEAKKEISNKWKQYDFYIGNVAKTNDNIDKINEKYHDNIPSLNEISSCLDMTYKIKSLNDNKDIEEENKIDKELLLYKEKFFDKDDINIEEIQNLINEYNQNKITLNNKLKKQSDNSNIALHNKFDNVKFNEEKIEEIDNLLKTYKENQNSLLSLTFSTNKKKSNLPLIILTLLSLISIILGIILLFKNMIPSIILLICGILLLLATIFIYFKNKTDYNIYGKMNDKTLLINDSQRQINEKLKKLSGELDLDFDNLEASLALYKEDYKKYLMLLQNEKSLNEEINKLTFDNNTLNNTITSFFNKYKYDGDNYQQLLLILINDLQKYKSLSNEKERLHNKILSISNEILSLKDNIDKITNKYNIGSDENSLKACEDDIKDLASLHKDIENYEKQAEDFKKANNLNERVEDINVDIVSLKNAYNEKLQEANKVKLLILELEDKKELIDEYNNELCKCEENILSYKNKINIIDKTKHALSNAESSLINKFITPIKSKFDAYQALIKKVANIDILLDQDLNVSYQENGVYHSEDHLSDGQKTIVTLLLRLALIDNMYDHNIPFIILDDPFTYLDEDNLKDALSLLDILKENYQIIYFTCHNSRI
ncbi:MAG: AAA family ATPase [Erysipelotrichaceae bacterium]|nr:AAA family ATPase [Erysipelotrichaceae bacterium]